MGDMKRSSSLLEGKSDLHGWLNQVLRIEELNQDIVLMSKFMYVDCQK